MYLQYRIHSFLHIVLTWISQIMYIYRVSSAFYWHYNSCVFVRVVCLIGIEEIKELLQQSKSCKIISAWCLTSTTPGKDSKAIELPREQHFKIFALLTENNSMHKISIRIRPDVTGKICVIFTITTINKFFLLSHKYFY